MLWDAFDMGYIVGVMCNSDGHKGRPGAEGPGAGQFGIANGLTCALAEHKTRESIFEALKSRRCYGTTGARIDLEFKIDEHEMGAIVENAPAAARVFAEVRGTAPIEKIELFEGKYVIHTVRPSAFDHLARSKYVRVSWRGSRIRGRGRRVNWDGKIHVTGPRIVSAKATFDTPLDKINTTSPDSVSFTSQTTGDTDFIDLELDRVAADVGAIAFDSQAGRCVVSFSDLTDEQPRKAFDFGGLDMSVTIERYPAELSETKLKLEHTVHPPADGKTTPYFVKVTQSDGQMAWASPIYLRRRES
jgi:hypothetical protein